MIQEPYHKSLVESFLAHHRDEYASVKFIGNDANVKEWRARDLGM